MYAINIGNTQHTVGNETQSNWCRWVANHLQFPGCTPKYGVIQCCTTQYFGESSQWMNHSLFGLICGIFQHVFWFSNMTHMVLVFEGITLTLAWLLANDELYSYTYLYVYIYINILYTQLYIYIYFFVWSVVSISRRNLNSPQKNIHRGNLNRCGFRCGFQQFKPRWPGIFMMNLHRCAKAPANVGSWKLEWKNGDKKLGQ